MKYNEAIGMIFNGGEAVLPSREYSKDYRLHFNEDGVLCVPRVEHTKSAPVLHKADLKRDDWIVKKDGVVYKEYHHFIGKKDWFKTFSEDVLCPSCQSKDLMKMKIQDVAPNWYACRNCQWQGEFVNLQPVGSEKVIEEIPPATKFTPFRESVIDEDWLEAKMLCFVRRYNNECGAFDKVTCGESGCQFCFPQAEPEGTLIPADKVILYTCIHGTYHCEECYEKYKKENKHSRQPREKVTVESLDKLINIWVRGVCYWEEANNPVEERRRSLSMAREAKEEIMKKLEYLVSLQEN